MDKNQEIVALYLYCIIPFNKVNNSNRQIALMAELIGRPNANSLKAKIGNFGCFDSNLSASGLGHSAVWMKPYGMNITGGGRSLK